MLVAVQAFVIASSLVFIIGIGVTSERIVDTPPANLKWKNADYLFIYSTFALFLIVYIVVLSLLINRLKQNFPAFYMKERTQIYIASGSVIVSLVARIGINVLYSFDAVNDALDLSFEEDTWLFPLSQLFVGLFASLFPIGSVTYSLIYALTHKKRMMKKSSRVNSQGRLINASGRC
jgi:hypothetical protein